MLEHIKLIIMKEELEMLKKAYNLLRNLFDMGYSYPSSIETLEGLARDIETLKINISENTKYAVFRKKEA
jgi:hypothetical protein